MCDVFTPSELWGLRAALDIVDRHEEYTLENKRSFRPGDKESLLAKVAARTSDRTQV